MALFTKLRERVIGSSVKFDDLEVIAPKEEDSEDSEAEDVKPKGVFLFRRSRKEKVVMVAPRKEEEVAPRLSNIYPPGKENFVNILPGNVNSDPTLSKKSVTSQIASELRSEIRSEVTVAEAPPLVGQWEQPAVVKDQLSSNQFSSNRASAQPTAQPTHPTQGPASPSATSTRAPSTVSAQSASASDNRDSRDSSDNRFSTSRVAGAGSKSASSSSKSIREDDHEESEAEAEAELTGRDLVDFVFSKARHNHSQAVFHALHSGFDINSRDANGNTLLHICCQNNRRKLLATLMEQHACDLNAKNSKALTALDFSDKYGFCKMSQFLASQGAVHGSQFTSMR
ncbi:hypothetical protein B484DRAFT_450061 [Ochromonadaceae sp. CCMP2298]|nr:hypothetical protein B484DRAFT_450061 [Ochromonadaceae sp. CCMP2298]